MSVIVAGRRCRSSACETEDGERFTREDLLGSTSVLVFYPFAFSSGLR